MTSIMDVSANLCRLHMRQVGSHSNIGVYHVDNNGDYTTMLAKKRLEKEATPNLAEMLKLLAFYSQVDTNVHPIDLLKYGGFIIKGLHGTKSHFSASRGSLGHYLAWNETLKVGICPCGWAGEEGWEYKMTEIQHKMHTRRSIPSA